MTPTGSDQTPPALSDEPPAANVDSPEAAQNYGQRLDAYTVLGLAVGLVMAIAGFFAMDVRPVIGQLAFACGLGMVLGAFGSTAMIKYKPLVITGSAAIALALAFFLSTELRQSYAILQIDGIPEGAKVEVYGERNFYGAERERLHEFVAMKDHMSSRLIGAAVTSPGEGDGGSTEYLFECISKKEVPLGSGEKIHWSFRPAQNAMLNATGQVIAEVGKCRAEANAQATQSHGWISRAFAQSPVDIPSLMKSLESPSSYRRRTARASLSLKGIDAVKPMLEALSAENPSYRTRLGVAVALTGMLRKDKGQRKALSELLEDEHLKLLVEAASDKDRTLRVYATEFLYDLGDPRSVKLALDRIPMVGEDGRYNLLIVVKGAIQETKEPERSLAIDGISALNLAEAPKTKILADQIAELALPGINQKFWVIAGSFSSKDNAANFADVINKSYPEFGAFIGERAPGNPFYPVVVGDYSERQAATELKQKLLESKIVNDAYLSDFPDRKAVP